MDASTSKPLVPVQRRAARACDQCRRHKTKCDGKAACIACTSNGLCCTYGSRTRRLKRTEYVAYLENRVSQLEGEKPTAKCSSSSETPSSRSDSVDTSATSLGLQESGNCRRHSVAVSKQGVDPDEDGQVEPERTSSEAIPIERTMSPTILDQEIPRYYGAGSGMEVLRRIASLCGRLSGLNFPHNSRIGTIPKFLDQPHHISSAERAGNKIRLPPTPVIRQLVQIALNEAFPMWPFVDESFVSLDLDSAHHLEQSHATVDKADQLGLIYVLIALGLWWASARRQAVENSVQIGIAQARRSDFFDAACAMFRAGRYGHSLRSIQLLMAMAQYLKAINAASACHSLVSTAAAGAIHIGLHEASHTLQRPVAERIRRERTYSALRIMDALTSCSLGVPRSLPAEPLINAVSKHAQSGPATAPEAFSTLIEILGQFRDTNYSGTDSIKLAEGSYSVPYERLQKVGEELNQWSSRVAQIDGVTWLTKGRATLDFCFFYVHLLIHSPFVHYLVSVNPSMQAIACATKAIDAATHTVIAAEALDPLGALDVHPYAVEALSLAAIVLRFIELSGTANASRTVPSRPARQLLERLAVGNEAASGCLEMLRELDLRQAVGGDLGIFGTTTTAVPDDLFSEFTQGWESFDASSQVPVDLPGVNYASAEGLTAMQTENTAFWPEPQWQVPPVFLTTIPVSLGGNVEIGPRGLVLSGMPLGEAFQ